jgi:hypothetical protein
MGDKMRNIRTRGLKGIMRARGNLKGDRFFQNHVILLALILTV